MNDFKKHDKSKTPENHLETKVFTPFQKMLLNGPIIDEGQAAAYKKLINKSRKWKV